MADNVQAELVVTPGATFATDDLTGVHHPYTKIEFGADGSATPVSAADPLPVDAVISGTVDVTGSDVTISGTVAVTDGGGSLTVDGTVSVTGVSTAAHQVTQTGLLTTIDADTSALAGTVVGTELQVDIVSPGTIALESGGNLDAINTATTASAASLATLDNIVSGSEAQVDIVSAGPVALEATLSTINAKLVSGTDIGDVTINNASGASAVNIQDGGNSITIDGTVTASNTTGNIASDSADSGNPVKIGHIAKTADITAVANNDRVDSVADTLGKVVTLIGSLHSQKLSGTATYTNTSAADVIAAQGAGVKTVVTGILVGNHHATVSTKVEIRDGTTVKIQCTAQAVGGGFAMQNPSGIFVGTANTAITARCVTTGADVDVSIQGYTISN